MDRKNALRKYDALELLTREHEAIKQLFWDYRRLVKQPADPERKGGVVSQLCYRLSIHTQIEEEIFYPAILGLLDKKEVESRVACDHFGEKLLVARLDEMEPDNLDYDATVADLSAEVVPHIYEEEEFLFPKLRKAGMDMAAVGLKLAQRRRSLHADVTRIGSPISVAGIAAAVSAWPVACHVETTSDVLAPRNWPDR